MPRRPPLGPAAALLLLAACTGDDTPSGPVAVPAPTLSAAPVVQACAALMPLLPQELADGVARREVRDPSRTAAWGDPAVTLRCGVPAPERVSEPLQVGKDGRIVTWTVRDVGDGFAFTTRDRSISVEVLVPGDDYSPSELLVRLARPITEAVPEPEAAPGA